MVHKDYQIPKHLCHCHALKGLSHIEWLLEQYPTIEYVLTMAENYEINLKKRGRDTILSKNWQYMIIRGVSKIVCLFSYPMILFVGRGVLGPMTELLAPAGSLDTVLTAIDAGADAVYLGGKSFNARKFAHNLDDEELDRAVRTAHLFAVKVYITVNILIADTELKELAAYLKKLDELHACGNFK